METGLEPEKIPAFHERFVELFEAHFHRVHRYLNRLSGDPELAADVAQEAFIKLYRRGSLPDSPEARLLTPARGEGVLADPPAAPDQALEAEDARRRVRLALDRMPEREQRMLLLRAEGYSYRDIASALNLNEASVGALLARARRAFREIYEETSGAP